MHQHLQTVTRVSHARKRLQREPSGVREADSPWPVSTKHHKSDSHNTHDNNSTTKSIHVMMIPTHTTTRQAAVYQLCTSSHSSTSRCNTHTHSPVYIYIYTGTDNQWCRQGNVFKAVNSRQKQRPRQLWQHQGKARMRPRQ